MTWALQLGSAASPRVAQDRRSPPDHVFQGHPGRRHQPSLRRHWDPQLARSAPGRAGAAHLAPEAAAQQPGRMSEEVIEQLVLTLHSIQAVKFGEFKLKSGLLSPVYVDLRVIVSHPHVLRQVADLMWERASAAQFDILCGVPYTALPIAVAMSLQHEVPMVLRRKEVKDYGTKKAIEGQFARGQRCLIVEDLVTSGASVQETVQPLEAEGLAVSDVVVLIDREQGGPQRLASQRLRLHSAFTLTYILRVLLKHKLVDPAIPPAVAKFLAENQTFPPPGDSAAAPAAPAAATAPAPASAPAAAPRRQRYEARAAAARTEVGRRLLELMARKRTNLALSADVADAATLLRLADQVGPDICVLKTHVDALDRWDANVSKRLAALADEHDFLLFEDRKFADIGNTVVAQYGGGPFRIADWAHLTNAHLLPGPGIIDGLRSVGLKKGRGLLLLAEMSSKGSLVTGEYTAAVAKAAEANQDFVAGFISQTPARWPQSSSPGLVHMTPGVQLAAGGDALGQQYNSPAAVLGAGGSDVIIVGRGITQAPDPAAAAAQYRAAGWEAYEAAVGPA